MKSCFTVAPTRTRQDTSGRDRRKIKWRGRTAEPYILYSHKWLVENFQTILQHKETRGARGQAKTDLVSSLFVGSPNLRQKD